MLDTHWLKTIRDGRCYVLGGGGPRSLVTLGLMKQAGVLSGAGVTLLHVKDGRRAEARRLECVRRQADFFALERVKELAVTTIFDHGRLAEPDGTPRGVMQWSQLLLSTSALAARTNVSRIVWPVACDGASERIAKAQEIVTLVQHLAQAEGVDRLQIDTPVLSLTDRQLVELGVRLGVMWSAAWACVQDGPSECGACAGCRRRWRAFDAAGLHDSEAGGLSGGRLIRAA